MYISPAVKQPKHVGYQSPSHSSEFRNAWSFTTIAPHLFMARRLTEYRDYFNFTSHISGMKMDALNLKT
jgi:hypothetical protein